MFFISGSIDVIVINTSIHVDFVDLPDNVSNFKGIADFVCLCSQIFIKEKVIDVNLAWGRKSAICTSVQSLMFFFCND